MEDIEKSLTVQILGDLEITELDFETREALPGWKEEGKDVYYNQVICLGKDGNPFEGHRSTEGEWVSIERIRKLLNDFESKGATHIAIEHHCDHCGYMFDYGRLSVSTPEEIVDDNLRRMKQEDQSCADEIKALEKRIAELREKNNQ